MTHTYDISGMTCSGCQQKVSGLLSKIPGVKNIVIDLPNGKAAVEMDQHISTAAFKEALKDYPKYQLSEADTTMPDFHAETEEGKSWFQTYKPILLIFAFVTTISVLSAFPGGMFNLRIATRIIMAGFFLVFSFFKLLDLDGFADSYSMYDIVAKRFRIWGYMYPFIELMLGLAFATNFQPALTNCITLIVMSASIIGVLQSVLNKRKIKCACLGAVFNLPMSTVTIVEDSLMIVMSLGMIVIMNR